MQSNETVDLIPKTKKELAHEYQYCPATIAKMCRNIGIFTCATLTIAEVSAFYMHYQPPRRNVPIVVFLEQKKPAS